MQWCLELNANDRMLNVHNNIGNMLPILFRSIVLQFLFGVQGVLSFAN